jgi:transposase
MPTSLAQRAYAKGQKNDFNDAEAIAEVVQRPTMKFVAVKTADQFDLQALHRVRERLVSQRTGITKQIRAFLLERGIAVRLGLRFLRAELPIVLSARAGVADHRPKGVVKQCGETLMAAEMAHAFEELMRLCAHRDEYSQRVPRRRSLTPLHGAQHPLAHWRCHQPRSPENSTNTRARSEGPYAIGVKIGSRSGV